MNFCPVCGKDTENKFCDEHRDINIHYKPIVLKMCKCGRYFYRNRWNKSSSVKQAAKKVAEDAIKEKAKVKPIVGEQIVKGEFGMEAHYNGEEFLLPAQLQVEQCPVCSKIKSGYFEATIQLRPKKKELLDFVVKQAEKQDEVFISKMTELDEGFDLQVSSNKFALQVGKKLNQSFKGELKKSKTLYGYDNQRSKKVYRGTVMFRLE
mgnify:CR=1 FL=1